MHLAFAFRYPLYSFLYSKFFFLFIFKLHKHSVWILFLRRSFPALLFLCSSMLIYLFTPLSHPQPLVLVSQTLIVESRELFPENKAPQLFALSALNSGSTSAIQIFFLLRHICEGVAFPFLLGLLNCFLVVTLSYTNIKTDFCIVLFFKEIMMIIMMMMMIIK